MTTSVVVGHYMWGQPASELDDKGLKNPRRLVEGKWRPPVDRILGKKRISVKNIWLLTASEGKRVILNKLPTVWTKWKGRLCRFADRVGWRDSPSGRCLF